MPRTIKRPEVRREEILATAIALMEVQGANDTSVDDIVRRAGLSKGAFYYYFESKDLLLDTLAGQAAEAARADIGAALAAAGNDTAARLGAVLRAARAGAGEMMALRPAGSIYLARNSTYLARLREAVGGVVGAAISDILAAGVRARELAAVDPRLVTEVILVLSAVTPQMVGELLSAATDAERLVASMTLQSRIGQRNIAIDRLLGWRDGTVNAFDVRFPARVLAPVSAGNSSLR